MKIRKIISLLHIMFYLRSFKGADAPKFILNQFLKEGFFLQIFQMIMLKKNFNFKSFL